MNNDSPKRKNIRLQGYDYNQNGAYFITMCIKDKRELLSQIDVGANCVRQQLSKIGDIVNDEISKLTDTYEYVNVDKYVVMPNHVHMIIAIDMPNSGRTQFAPTISRIIKQFKGSITKKIGDSIWQKSFHDHIIRNEAEYQKIWKYIDENAAKWADDCYYSG